VLDQLVGDQRRRHAAGLGEEHPGAIAAASAALAGRTSIAAA